MTTHRQLAFALALSALAVGASGAQTLDDRVAAAPGTVAFEFAARDNVCGDGHGIFISDDTAPGWNVRRRRSGTTIRDRGDDGGECEIAPARVVLQHEGRRVTSLRVSVGGSPRRVDGELGRVSAAEGARFLLVVAPQLDGRSANDAVLGASIADVPRVWPRLLEIARDGRASESARKASLFWLSNEAAAAAVEGLASVAEDDDASLSVRSDAVFFLAQQKDGAGVPALIRIVRQSQSRKIRKDALWHLGQSRDPRALELFEQLLAGR